MPRLMPSRRLAFTLIELLIVIAIIGILVGILVPVTQRVRASTRRMSCQNNLRQLMLSLLDHENLKGSFPKADNGRGGSLFVELLPHIDQKYLFDRSIADLNVDDDATDAQIAAAYLDRLNELSADPVDILFCPSGNDTERVANRGDDTLFSAHYFGVAGPSNTAGTPPATAYRSVNPEPVGGNVSLGGMFAPDANGQFTLNRGNKDALDGASVTIAIGEISRFALTSAGGIVSRAGWAKGAEHNSATGELENVFAAKSIEFAVNSGKGSTNNVSFNSPHSGGAQFGFIDARVQFVSDTIDAEILKAYASTNGQERVISLEQQ